MASRPLRAELAGIPNEPFTEGDFKAGLAKLGRWLECFATKGIEGRPLGSSLYRGSAFITFPPPSSPGITPATLSTPGATSIDLSGVTVITGATI